MPQSDNLATETQVMRRIESAYRAVETLPSKAARRVMAWAKDEFHDGHDSPQGSIAAGSDTNG